MLKVMIAIAVIYTAVGWMAYACYTLAFPG
jgi:hypothetical protein